MLVVYLALKLAAQWAICYLDLTSAACLVLKKVAHLELRLVEHLALILVACLDLMKVVRLVCKMVDHLVSTLAEHSES